MASLSTIKVANLAMHALLLFVLLLFYHNARGTAVPLLRLSTLLPLLLEIQSLVRVCDAGKWSDRKQLTVYPDRAVQLTPGSTAGSNYSLADAAELVLDASQPFKCRIRNCTLHYTSGDVHHVS